MELKDRIAAVRKAAGLTQEQLGELLGVTRQAVSKWESGQTAPDAATLAALCEQLHVSADYVLLGKEPEESGSAGPAFRFRLPLCGRKVFGNSCPQCGYRVPGLSAAVTHRAMPSRPPDPALSRARSGAEAAAALLRLHPGGRPHSADRPLCGRPVPHPAAPGA